MDSDFDGLIILEPSTQNAFDEDTFIVRDFRDLVHLRHCNSMYIVSSRLFLTTARQTSDSLSQSCARRSSAMRTSWLRVRTPVLSKSCCIAAFTELSEIVSFVAISLFESPSNTALSTACSRGVNGCDARCSSDFPDAPATSDRTARGS